MQGEGSEGARREDGMTGKLLVSNEYNILQVFQKLFPILVHILGITLVRRCCVACTNRKAKEEKREVRQSPTYVLLLEYPPRIKEIRIPHLHIQTRATMTSNPR